MDDIATAVGIGRRTLFRYYPSKNDIPWGQFDESLDRLEAHLASTPDDVPVHKAVQRAVLDFNRLDAEQTEQHRRRMTLLMTTPALQAHAALKHAAWRGVIARYVARRFDLPIDALLPRTAGRVALALALSAYEQWLMEDDSVLTDLLDQSLGALRSYLLDEPPLTTGG